MRALLFAAIGLVLASFPYSAAAQEDPIGLRCMQSKLKGAGRSCSCVHRAWAKAIVTGALPDLTRCNDKLESVFLAAESQATSAGGACFAGDSVAAVADAIDTATDKTLSQVGRGTFGPAPTSCDSGDHYDMIYSGGDYTTAMKCVKLQPTDLDCTGPKTRDKLQDAIENDVKCPDFCTEGEEGCIPEVTVSSANIRDRNGDFCCLHHDVGNTKNSLSVSVVCTTCYTP